MSDTPVSNPPPTQEKSSERLEAARRRLLEPPVEPPFWRSAEFQRVGALLFLLLVVGGFGIMYYWSQMTREQQQAEQAALQALEGAPVPPDPALREQRLGTLFQGALADSRNGDDFRETGGYGILVREVASYSPEEVHAKAKRWLDYDGCVQDPDGWRGEFVRHRGLVKDLHAEKLDLPVLGIKDVWRGFMTEADHHSEKLVFDLVEEPPEIRFNYDAWDIEGVLYRMVRFEDKSGKFQEVPYILARSIRPRDDPGSATGILGHPMVLLLAVVGLALFLARLLLFLSKTRRPAPVSAGTNVRQLMMKQRAQRPAPPTPPPAS